LKFDLNRWNRLAGLGGGDEQESMLLSENWEGREGSRTRLGVRMRALQRNNPDVYAYMIAHDPRLEGVTFGSAAAYTRAVAGVEGGWGPDDPIQTVRADHSGRRVVNVEDIDPSVLTVQDDEEITGGAGDAPSSSEEVGATDITDSEESSAQDELMAQAVESTLPNVVLNYGAGGQNVGTVQRHLALLSDKYDEERFSQGEPDNDYKSLTANAISYFQAAADIDIDGSYGPNTRAAMVSAFESDLPSGWQQRVDARAGQVGQRSSSSSRGSSSSRASSSSTAGAGGEEGGETTAAPTEAVVTWAGITWKKQLGDEEDTSLWVSANAAWIDPSAQVKIQLAGLALVGQDLISNIYAQPGKISIDAGSRVTIDDLGDWNDRQVDDEGSSYTIAERNLPKTFNPETGGGTTIGRLDIGRASNPEQFSAFTDDFEEMLAQAGTAIESNTYAQLNSLWASESQPPASQDESVVIRWGVLAGLLKG